MIPFSSPHSPMREPSPPAVSRAPAADLPPVGGGRVLSDVVEVPLTKGCVSIVDAADAWVLRWKWSAAEKRRGGRLYAMRSAKIGQRWQTVYLHRVVLGAAASNSIIDHIDGDALNNRRDNLRIVTHRQNCHNIDTDYAGDAATGILGVTKKRNAARWSAFISDGGRKVYLGTFLTPGAAAVARAREEVRRWGIEPRRREELERWLSSGIDPDEFRTSKGRIGD